MIISHFESIQVGHAGLELGDLFPLSKQTGLKGIKLSLKALEVKIGEVGRVRSAVSSELSGPVEQGKRLAIA